MEKEIECITLENEQEYGILEKIKDQSNEYIYLFNLNNVKDFCIRKLIKDEICGLDSEEEYIKALGLLRNKNKDLINKLGL